MPRNDFLRVDYDEPHAGRTRAMLSSHPELRALFGPHPPTAAWAAAIVALQLMLGVVAAHCSLTALLLLAYGVGAVANHALWVIIHECAHRLVFRGSMANRAVALLACWPQVLPAGAAFCRYHMLHHVHQGDVARDADLPTPAEARLVGDSTWRKATWLLLFTLVQALRPASLARVRTWDPWFVLDLASQAVFLWVYGSLAGPWAVLYLLLSTAFAIGLHPLGGRWLAEHYITRLNGSMPDDAQETFSYYGPLNRICFNVGYHVEHHDLMQVAWCRLPAVRRAAPEFYDGLRAHPSWTWVMLRFIFDPRATLFDRVVRHAEGRSRRPR